MILNKLFSAPAIVLIGSKKSSGAWKTGKTDFSLFLAEQLLKLELVHEVATNIYTSEAFTYISDLENLKRWLDPARNKKTKLYIFDELNVHLPARRAMSNKSVDIITLFPEISKARARLIGVGQKLSGLDSELKDTTWVRGWYEKIDLKTVRVFSPLLNKSYVFRKIPSTSIKFDPFLTAPFQLKATSKIMLEDEDMAKYSRWLNGATWKDEFKNPNECNRFVRKMGKRLMTEHLQVYYTSVEGTAKAEGKALDQK